MSDAAMLERPASSADTSVRFTPEQLSERAIHRRAVEAVIWGMPAVNFDLMLQALIEGGGGPNQIALWSRPPDGKNQTLTPNPNTIYLMPFFDTRWNARPARMASALRHASRKAFQRHDRAELGHCVEGRGTQRL